MILVNSSNLHTGGGVQVAVSFLTEMASLELPQGLSLFVSDEVHRNLTSAGYRPPLSVDYRVENTHGFDLVGLFRRGPMDRFKTVFTIFGPLYRLRPPFRSIVGFAQPWIIYPNNECYAMLPPLERLKMRLKFRIQSWFFRRADMIVVELEHVRQGLVRELGIPPERIHVVHNCLSSLYQKEELWRPVDIPEVACDLRLGFLGRNYLHKNTAIFPRVAEILRRKYGIDAKFFVTFTEDEWQACSPEFRAACVNLGPLNVAQCPSFYRAMDAVVFPSLLECFSATPLEAMAMERPLIASDRPFNRDVCGAHAHYFDPLDPESAAAQIAAVFEGAGPDPQALRAARDHAINFSSPRKRAEKYLELISSAR